MFLEMWKRRQAVIAWEWDLTTFEDDEQTRPEFEVKVKTKRINPVTKKPEPFLPGWNKAVRVVFTTSFVFLMVRWWENVQFPQDSYKYFAYQLSVLFKATKAVFRRQKYIISSYTGKHRKCIHSVNATHLT